MLAACAAAVISLPAAAQEYPTRQIRIVVPLSPGGSADIVARFVSHDLTERLGKVVIVDNRVGGGGHIGADLVAKAAPDGYTLLSAGIPHAIGMSLYKKLPYDLARDLAPVIQCVTFPSAVTVHPSLPVRSIRELIALAKSQPGRLTFGANTGSPNHLGVELLNLAQNTKMIFIPYKGAGQVVSDIVAGHIDLALLGFPPAVPMVKAGRLRAIAVTGTARSDIMPDVPTVAESGIPGYNVTSWYGIFAPAGTPAAIIGKLNAEISASLKNPETRRKLIDLGADVVPTTPERFGQIVREEIAKWAKVVKASGATAE
jgi:tripartite-type tricarboxylate transporter receptor subunit TctC